jgi:hypothetical protein
LLQFGQRRACRSDHALARGHFFRFRQLIQPNIVWNWRTREVSDHLEQFYHDRWHAPAARVDGPTAAWQTKLVTDFIAWLGGL